MNKDDWISVNDRLPDTDDVFYLTYGIDGITTRPFSAYHNCWDDSDGDDYYCKPKGERITHWMQLPEAP